jgi:hypothetical protein
MADRKVAPLDEFHHQSRLMHPFQKHPVYLNLNVVDVFGFHLLIFHWFIASAFTQIFPRSQPMREYNTSTRTISKFSLFPIFCRAKDLTKTKKPICTSFSKCSHSPHFHFFFFFDTGYTQTHTG